MLKRTPLSRRRRAPRSTLNSRGTIVIPEFEGRRASFSPENSITLAQFDCKEKMERRRSQVIPIVAFGTDGTSTDEAIEMESNLVRPDMLEPDQYSSASNTLMPDMNRPTRNYYRSHRNVSQAADTPLSPRNNSVHEDRSPRHSLTPDMPHGSRHSLISLSPRNSLVPDVGHNRSPRNSTVPLTASRTSLMPENGSIASGRRQRYSLVPDRPASPRGSIAHLEYDRSPRGSICAELNRPPRASSTPLDFDRGPRGSITSDCVHQSPRGSIVPDSSRSPRGSICPESTGRYSRGSIGSNEDAGRVHRRSIEYEGHPMSTDKRSSLGGMQEGRASRGSFHLHDSRRTSVDQGSRKNRNLSPYHQTELNSRHSKGDGNPAVSNVGFGPDAVIDSRRASCSVSQVSGDESHRLFNDSVKSKKKIENTTPTAVAYGSVVFQLMDANFEANNTCEFVFRALKVVSKTSTVTVYLSCLSIMPIVMFVFGLQFFKECPQEKHIPEYLLIGGIFGSVYMFLMLYAQIRSRKMEVLTVPPEQSQLSPIALAFIALSVFLTCWFVYGNYWIFGIMWPNYEREMYPPDVYCNKRLYIFSLIHLGVVHTALGSVVLLAIGLAFFRLLSCPLPNTKCRRKKGKHYGSPVTTVAPQKKPRHVMYNQRGSQSVEVSRMF